MRLALLLALTAVAAAAPPSEEIGLGFLPAPWAASALAKSLSPQGRYTLATPRGPIQVTDAPANVALARRAISELQAAPALVSLDLSFTAMVRKPAPAPLAMGAQPVRGDGIPVPSQYTPPRVAVGANGTVVVPTQPRNFTTRKTGTTAGVESIGTAPVADTPPLPGEPLVASGIARRLQASTTLGKPVTLSLNKAADAAALHSIASKLGAIPQNEPAWNSVTTELVITPELRGDVLDVKLMPQLVIAGAEPRRIPLPQCAAGVPIAPARPSNTGTLPGTDPAFYRAFLGAPIVTDKTLTALTVAASVQYLGTPPK